MTFDTRLLRFRNRNKNSQLLPEHLQKEKNVFYDGKRIAIIYCRPNYKSKTGFSYSIQPVTNPAVPWTEELFVEIKPTNGDYEEYLREFDSLNECKRTIISELKLHDYLENCLEEKYEGFLTMNCISVAMCERNTM